MSPDRAASFMLRSPLGRLIRGVARIRASVHAKLLTAFMLVAVLVLAMGAVSLQMLWGTARDTRLLDEAHQRVDASRQLEHALALQMHYTGQALLERSEGAVGRILRENNRFNDTLARLEAAAPEDERALIRTVRNAQDDAMAVVADIANALRDGRPTAGLAALQAREASLYASVEESVRRLVGLEQSRMGNLRTGLDAANRRSLMLLAGFAAGALALAMLAGFVISWSFIVPVREVHTGLREVAAGNFAATISVPNRDEFGELAEQLNRMTRELARLQARQDEAAAELTGMNDRLQHASRAKSEFLANMSHELRTPLNAILGFTEMMRDGLYGEVPPELDEPLADIQTNGRHLLRLINDVLDLSKIEAGRMELAPGDYTVSEMLDTVRASLRSLAEAKGLELTVAAPADIPPARGDVKRLTQCLMNFVGNAVKFTRAGSVTVEAQVEGSNLLFRVRDTGIGIPKEQLDHVFDEFRQVDATITREFGGSGLGLAITRRFVELHGGRIGVESELGRGTTFWFTVPLRVDDPRPGIEEGDVRAAVGTA
jgi:signal transduction histidine kinase